MTYLQLEAMTSTEAAMTGAGYSPVSGSTIRFDEQERTGYGFQAVKVAGLGMAPVAITATPNQVGSSPRFVRKLERNIDIALSVRSTSAGNRDSRLAKLWSILEGECILRLCEDDGNSGIALPASYKYLRVYYAGGGTFALGGDDGATEYETELIITLRAHKPDWKTGG